MEKPTVYTVFANSVKDHLPNLTDEALSITHIFLPLAFNDKLYYIKDEIFDVERLTQNFSKYGNKYTIFYFSGHSKDGCLNLTNDFKIEAKPMSDIILNSLKNIQLIFLNACETFPLAKEIIRQLNVEEGGPVIISCGTEINTYLGETFAKLLFEQIGQQEPIRKAYDSAKSLVTALAKNSKIIFREFDNKNDVIDSDNDFTIGYIELKKKTSIADGPPAPAKKHSSMIGDDKLTRDALSTNYLTSIVESISSTPNVLEKKTITALSNALEAAKQVAGGKKEDKDVKKVFDKAAFALPGIDSRRIFSALINTEKNLDATKVKSYIKNDGSVINNLQQMVNKIDLIDI